MSVIHHGRGEEELHYPGGSHRWEGGPGPSDPAGEDRWRARVQDHMDEHRRTMGPPRTARQDPR